MIDHHILKNVLKIANKGGSADGIIEPAVALGWKLKQGGNITFDRQHAFMVPQRENDIFNSSGDSGAPTR